MCGLIVSRSERSCAAGVEALHHRGPDGNGIVLADGWWLGHTRLAILDLSDLAAQPMTIGDVTLVYNGELWNHATLRDGLSAVPVSSGDTEVLATLIAETDNPATIGPMLDGQFAAVWVRDGVLHAIRDRCGEVPLHYGYHARDRTLLVASELKALLEAGAHPQTIAWVPPGTLLQWEDSLALPSVTKWHEFGLEHVEDTLAEATNEVDRLLADAVRKRATVSDVPVATLISGGIDSSAVTWHAHPDLPELVAYTAVFDESSLDLRCAREVAEHMGIELIEVRVPAPTAEDLAATVAAIEMPHKAQVEIGWACLHLARRLRSDGIKVCLSGEGADELWASYGRSYHAVQKSGWHKSRAESVVNQHRKNFARVNKVFMAHSVEGRLPFADRYLLDYGLRLPRNAVLGRHWEVSGKPAQEQQRPLEQKMVLRKAYLERLPHSVVRRDKAAFQTEARIPQACEDAVANPQKFYRTEYQKQFGMKRS